ncbi:Stp1/IreP family PP2C-type Ser/Thr phosphatase [Clostridium sp. MB40-C1]|uniref:Stp1/IreP family PP2C-type Ser/Thr phosphatase n=1 Tax=Clostridium sp. MB40-C1 TaxID=3070996 RepID=UPI0027E081A3|nr:Stp1/IreP family PP2C-type Ser/Thr phosphatase [Clostridium sp. MB40-C1]WMJ82095.1 Stp1/IreP family PP2C-type Ser/Thr phosphatase [Clostridium sp. MB40-C1]
MNIYRQNNEKGIVGYLSDKGNVREINEDYLDFYGNEAFQLYVVADGMGGHNAGEIASKMAVESCINYIKNSCEIDDAVETLRNSIIYANEVVYKESKRNYKLNGMGTTITACLLKDDHVVIANVGDSSCFIVDESGVEKITKDHSLVQQLIDDGSITEEEATNHPNKNIITRALGTKRRVEIDIFVRKRDEITKVILCTDGLTNEVNKDEMYDIILRNKNGEACELLVELAKNKGGRDNISVLIFGGEC